MSRTLKLRWLLLGEFFGSFGNSFIWPLTTIYMHNQLHQSLTISGIILMLYSGFNVLGSYVAGIRFDHHDPRRMMIGGLIGAIGVMGILVKYNSWPYYPILLISFGFFNGWIITILNAFGTQLVGQKSRFVFNMLYFTNNLGVVFGTMVAGPLYQLNGNRVSILFAITIGMHFIYLLIVRRFFILTSMPLQSEKHKVVGPRASLPNNNDYSIWMLFISIAIIWVTYSQWSSNFSVYMTGQGISMMKYSLLWTINGVLIVVFQPIITWLTRRITNDYWLVYFGVLMFIFSFAILMLSHTYLMFVLGMGILTLGEITVFPTILAIVNLLTPANVKGRYQGLLNAWISIGKALGPLIGGMMIQIFSYQGLFLFCTGSLGLVALSIMSVRLISKNTMQKF